ncbi:uncharacterized protein J4E87_002891 [Alternaria ethzedia]|uniref:uncharacterized protein n=1 Tax=Alternaria viburni TaxID=566460 RepID=UPI0020C37C91|nr:uncharacterized protein J4E79_000518 [Alternaria viburni]XP_049235516.1 uncharacterized protein J4E87_002891 [Alternaria ethzedia]KAI4629705.1 hypothetical protein J4E87_002891 [Alternaria ethzedia]KAI4670237.1 hypothetical protein J4E79_000518 [Alternaria viburni]
MAPVDRREHRQQRVRGAGPSSVQASFGFNFGALSSQPTKQPSLPPQQSPRRTPAQKTPRSANGSAQRQRSASIQRSSTSKRKATPKENTVTPQLGKRKRGSPNAQPGPDDAAEDELSPDREDAVRSIEQSRRIVGTVLPIREEQDNVPDELSILEEGASTARETVFAKSTVIKRTPPQASSQIRATPVSARKKTPATEGVEQASAVSRRPTLRRSRSTDPGPATPSVLLNGQPRTSSASQLGAILETPAAASVDEESEDELSPQLNGSTPRVVGSEPRPQRTAEEDIEMDADELSSLGQPTPIQQTPVANGATPQHLKEQQSEEQATPPQPAKRGRPRRVVEEPKEVEVPATTATKPAKRGRPRKEVAVQEREPQAAPAVREPEVTNSEEPTPEEVSEVLDDVSPDHEQASIHSPKPTPRNQDAVEISSADEESDVYEEPEPEEAELTPRPKTRNPSPKQTQRAKPTSEKPPRKRQKFLGPKHTISVMRIKGSAVRGITVADTTRTILEETIDHRLGRMAEKLQASQDSTRRKEYRSEINLSLSFKESLNEKLLDLQDANDLLSTNFKKIKLFKRDNAELRREILSLQDSRQEIAIETDDVQARYNAEKAEVDARNTLSDDMFEIEAAIKNGRKKARKDGREEEGPNIPLPMLLQMVGNDVTSRSGGLLANVKGFNRLLERAAGFLEGRA